MAAGAKAVATVLRQVQQAPEDEPVITLYSEGAVLYPTDQLRNAAGCLADMIQVLNNNPKGARALVHLLRAQKVGLDDELTIQAVRWQRIGVDDPDFDDGQDVPETPEQAFAVADAQELAGLLAHMLELPL